MEKDKRAIAALENELELGAVAEAQVAQAEGLIQIVSAIKEFQESSRRRLFAAAATAATVSICAICFFISRSQSVEQAQNEWLWKSHHLLISLILDDPKLLTDAELSWFLTHASQARIDGYRSIAGDGSHPRTKLRLDEVRSKLDRDKIRNQD